MNVKMTKKTTNNLGKCNKTSILGLLTQISPM